MENRYSGFFYLVLARMLVVSGSPAIAGDFGVSVPSRGKATFTASIMNKE